MQRGVPASIAKLGSGSIYGFTDGVIGLFSGHSRYFYGAYGGVVWYFVSIAVHWYGEQRSAEYCYAGYDDVSDYHPFAMSVLGIGILSDVRSPVMCHYALPPLMVSLKSGFFGNDLSLLMLLLMLVLMPFAASAGLHEPNAGIMHKASAMDNKRLMMFFLLFIFLFS
jgi:uncharacterized membrane protein YqaE (UPF0057 family)